MKQDAYLFVFPEFELLNTIKTDDPVDLRLQLDGKFN
jgi:hypothetical protein